MLTLSVIIPTWNRRQMVTASALAVTESVVPGGAEIIVVDNGSSDGTQEYLKSLKLPKRLKVLRSDSNLGYAGGINLGLTVARGKYVLIMNNDIVVAKTCLKYLCEVLDKHPDIGGVGPVVVGQKSYGKIDSQTLRLVNYLQPDYTGPVEAPVFCAIMVRKKVLDQIGPLDQKLFHYGEDVDFFLRANKLGVKFWVECRAKVQHVGSSSMDPKSDRGRYYLIRNEWYVWRKYGRLTAIKYVQVVGWAAKSLILGDWIVVRAVGDFLTGRMGKRL